MTQQKLLKQSITHLEEQMPNVQLLVLFGSRARGNAQLESDWDFAVLYDDEISKNNAQSGCWDWLKIWSVLAEIFDLSEDQIDVINLATCSPWLAHCVARDGKVLFEKEAGEFERFQQKSLKSKSELKTYRHRVREKVKSALQRWKT